MSTKPESVASMMCLNCEISKSPIDFYARKKTICKDCFNERRREKYKNNEEHRQKIIKMATEFKKKKTIVNQQIKLEKQLAIGLENKQCRYCETIKPKERFRHNRLKCKDCERDDPPEKFKRYVRTRIYNCLRNKNKTQHSIVYLGCSSEDYFKWMFKYDDKYNLENHGKLWHIDHVVPLSLFDLNDETQQLIAFNWRNTMPLNSKENMSKNNRISITQIKNHFDKLVDYHKENNIYFPQEFINLFAKHLDAGSPLEPIWSNKSENHYQVCERKLTNGRD